MLTNCGNERPPWSLLISRVISYLQLLIETAELVRTSVRNLDELAQQQLCDKAEMLTLHFIMFINILNNII